MPLALMKRKVDGCLDGVNFRNVMEAMPQIVADALTAPADPDGKLTSEDVEVWEAPTVNIAYGDIGHHDLQIIIFAHDFPSRMANLGERREQIIAKVKPLLQKGATFFVWVICAPTSWGEAVGEAEA